MRITNALINSNKTNLKTPDFALKGLNPNPVYRANIQMIT